MHRDDVQKSSPVAAPRFSTRPQAVVAAGAVEGLDNGDVSSFVSKNLD
jgi:hypothetical protein